MPVVLERTETAGMDGNDTLRSNSTNSTLIYIFKDFSDMVRVYRTLVIFISVVGTLLNLWFLVAILCSRDTRSRLRNKIICNSLVLHLLDTVVILPFNFARFFRCELFSAFQNLVLIQDFIGNWLLVMLLAVFIAQIEDFNPKMKLTPVAITIGTVALLVFPWVASLVLVPVIVHEYYNRRKWPMKGCLYPTRDALEVFRTVDTAVPIALAILLIIGAVILRYRRFSRGFSSTSMQSELISRSHQVDSPLGYIAATFVSTVCDLFQLLYELNMFTNMAFKSLFTMRFASMLMAHSRAILMPLPWLLLPDIRQQIRTWRPWYHPAPGIDLTVAYKKDEI